MNVRTHVLTNARLQLEELARMPAFTVPSIGLPLVTYLIFGLPGIGDDQAKANGVLVGFAAFALLGIVMFQFGVGIAAERLSPWDRYVRTLPAPPSARFTARLLVALLFGAATLVPVAVVAVLTSPVSLGPLAWARVLLGLVAGAVPLGLFGIMLGYLLGERGALPITNLLYLPLSYAGGLFSGGTASLPHAIDAVSPWLPTRQWSDLLLDFGLAGRIPATALLGLLGYGVGFAAVAYWAYRRDELREYR